MLLWLRNLLPATQAPHRSVSPAAVLGSDLQPWQETVARIASEEVGVMETAANAGPRIRDYQLATWLKPGPWPWCAAFVCWCVLQAMRVHGMQDAFTRPRTAGAWDLERWARRYYGPVVGWSLYNPQTSEPRRGDILIFTFSHCGICTGYDARRKEVSTVEGNTNAKGARDGDGVCARTRKLSAIRRIIRYKA